jgi:LCP family protein required for cell wall assembly
MSIDLLPENNKIEQSKKGLFFFGRIFVSLIVIFAVGAAVFSYQVVTSEEASEDSFIGRVGKLPVFSGLKYLTGSSERGLRGTNENRTNFLLLGVGGFGHNGPDLSDTIIIGSLRHSDGKIGMMSLPRDLSVDIPGYGWRKINHANAFGEWEKEGYGPILASQIVSNISGQPIHYYVRIDFNGFVEFIDEIGGIDVNVKKSFTDYQYPTADDKYQVVSFEAGLQHMDGDTALKYVRSRHGTNGEASDFARSRRQQNVLVAVKNKIFTPSLLLNPKKILELYDTVKENIETNITTREMLTLVQLSRKVDTENIINQVLDTGPNSPLYATSINGAYMILPRGGTWDNVRQISANIFEEESSFTPSSASATSASSKESEKINIEIQNGTTIPGLAYATSLILKDNDFYVAKIGNALERDYENTVIFDMTNGTKSEELTLLQSLLDANVSVSASGWIFSSTLVPSEVTVHDGSDLVTVTNKDIDFLVILGQSSKNLVQ